RNTGRNAPGHFGIQSSASPLSPQCVGTCSGSDGYTASAKTAIAANSTGPSHGLLISCHWRGRNAVALLQGDARRHALRPSRAKIGHAPASVNRLALPPVLVAVGPRSAPPLTRATPHGGAPLAIRAVTRPAGPAVLARVPRHTSTVGLAVPRLELPIVRPEIPALPLPAVLAAFVAPAAAEREPVVVGRAVGLFLAVIPRAPVRLAATTHRHTRTIAAPVAAVTTLAPPARPPALARPPGALRLEAGPLRRPPLAVPRAVATLHVLALPAPLAPGPPLPPGLAPARRTRKPVAPCHAMPPLGWMCWGWRRRGRRTSRAGDAPAQSKRSGGVARSVLGRDRARPRRPPLPQRSAEVRDAHRRTHALHRLGRDRPHRAVARVQHVLHQRGIALQCGAPLADRVQERVQRARQLPLHLHVAHPALPVALLQVLDLRTVRVEEVLVDEDGVPL